jgi:hypothetical protein
MSNDLLFYGSGDMFSVVQTRRAQVSEAVERISKDKFLNASEEDLVAALCDDLHLDVPTISDEPTVESHETKKDVSRDPMRLILDPSRPFYVPATEIVISIPFSGDAAFFRIRPSTFSLNPPRGVISGNELRLSYIQETPDGQSLKQRYESDLRQINESLRNLVEMAQQFHNELPNLVRTKVQERKKRLLSADGLVAALGLKLKPRPDAVKTYSLPARKRVPKIEQIPSSNQQFKPEPALVTEDYEDILRIISNMAIVMEQSPSAFIGMNEESLRTHFLVQLNGQYEGQATGETFNFEGKTDILIRVEGRNIFIAECKFWTGPKEFLAAIDQLLSYLSWRDTKAALIVFSRNANFTDVLTTISRTVPTHAHWKRTVKESADTGFRYIFKQPGDVSREVILTVLAFNIPTQPAKTLRAGG